MALTTRCLSEEDYAARVQSIRTKLYRMAFCYVKNEQDALDIVSEAVYKGYVKRETLREPSFFDTWMTRIVIHCALDFCRAHSRVVWPYEDAASDVPAPDEGLTPDARIDLYAALDTLPPADKTLIVLKFFEDLRFSDIARTLNIPENTAKTRLYRALARLKQQLSPEEGRT